MKIVECSIGGGSNLSTVDHERVAEGERGAGCSRCWWMGKPLTDPIHHFLRLVMSIQPKDLRLICLFRHSVQVDAVKAQWDRYVGFGESHGAGTFQRAMRGLHVGI